MDTIFEQLEVLKLTHLDDLEVLKISFSEAKFCLRVYSSLETSKMFKTIPFRMKVLFVVSDYPNKVPEVIMKECVIGDTAEQLCDYMNGMNMMGSEGFKLKAHHMEKFVAEKKIFFVGYFSSINHVWDESKSYSPLIDFVQTIYTFVLDQMLVSNQAFDMFSLNNDKYCIEFDRGKKADDLFFCERYLFVCEGSKCEISLNSKVASKKCTYHPIRHFPVCSGVSFINNTFTTHYKFAFDLELFSKHKLFCGTVTSSKFKKVVIDEFLITLNEKAENSFINAFSQANNNVIEVFFNFEFKKIKSFKEMFFTNTYLTTLTESRIYGLTIKLLTALRDLHSKNSFHGFFHPDFIFYDEVADSVFFLNQNNLSMNLFLLLQRYVAFHCYQPTKELLALRVVDLNFDLVCDLIAEKENSFVAYLQTFDVYNFGVLVLALFTGSYEKLTTHAYNNLSTNNPQFKFNVPKNLPVTIKNFLNKCLALPKPSFEKFLAEPNNLLSAELLLADYFCQNFSPMNSIWAVNSIKNNPNNSLLAPYSQQYSYTVNLMNKQASLYLEQDNSQLSSRISRDMHRMLEHNTNKKDRTRLEKEFESFEALGHGGFGSVISARNKIDSNIYAIKRINMNLKKGKKSAKHTTEQIYREVQILSSLYHENVVRYYNVWIDGELNTDKVFKTDSSDELTSLTETESNSSISSDSENILFDESEESTHSSFGTDNTNKLFFYIQMEYCDNTTLRDLIDNEQLFASEEKITHILKGILNGLDYIHNQNIIHYDIKPINVFMCKNGSPKIGDFGFATSFKSFCNESQNVALGTAFYTSPEVLYKFEHDKKVSEQRITCKTDMYSLGITLFEMCTPPFKTQYERALTLNSLTKESGNSNEQYNVFLKNNKDIGSNNKLIISMLINKSPEMRPSAYELLYHSKLIPIDMEEIIFNQVVTDVIGSADHLNCVDENNVNKKKRFNFLIGSLFDLRLESSIRSNFSNAAKNIRVDILKMYADAQTNRCAYTILDLIGLVNCGIYQPPHENLSEVFYTSGGLTLPPSSYVYEKLYQLNFAEEGEKKKNKFILVPTYYINETGDICECPNFYIKRILEQANFSEDDFSQTVYGVNNVQARLIKYFSKNSKNQRQVSFNEWYYARVCAQKDYFSCAYSLFETVGYALQIVSFVKRIYKQAAGLCNCQESSALAANLLSSELIIIKLNPVWVLSALFDELKVCFEEGLIGVTFYYEYMDVCRGVKNEQIREVFLKELIKKYAVKKDSYCTVVEIVDLLVKFSSLDSANLVLFIERVEALLVVLKKKNSKNCLFVEENLICLKTIFFLFSNNYEEGPRANENKNFKIAFKTRLEINVNVFPQIAHFASAIYLYNIFLKNENTSNYLLANGGLFINSRKEKVKIHSNIDHEHFVSCKRCSSRGEDHRNIFSYPAMFPIPTIKQINCPHNEHAVAYLSIQMSALNKLLSKMCTKHMNGLISPVYNQEVRNSQPFCRKVCKTGNFFNRKAVLIMVSDNNDEGKKKILIERFLKLCKSIRSQFSMHLMTVDKPYHISADFNELKSRFKSMHFSIVIMVQQLANQVPYKLYMLKNTQFVNESSEEIEYTNIKLESSNEMGFERMEQTLLKHLSTRLSMNLTNFTEEVSGFEGSASAAANSVQEGGESVFEPVYTMVSREKLSAAVKRKFINKASQMIHKYKGVVQTDEKSEFHVLICDLTGAEFDFVVANSEEGPAEKVAFDERQSGASKKTIQHLFEEMAAARKKSAKRVSFCLCSVNINRAKCLF